MNVLHRVVRTQTSNNKNAELLVEGNTYVSQAKKGPFGLEYHLFRYFHTPFDVQHLKMLCTTTSLRKFLKRWQSCLSLTMSALRRNEVALTDRAFLCQLNGVVHNVAMLGQLTCILEIQNATMDTLTRSSSLEWQETQIFLFCPLFFGSSVAILVQTLASLRLFRRNCSSLTFQCFHSL